MLTLFSNNKEIPLKRVDFSDGAFSFKIDELPPDAEYICINVDPSTPVNLVREELLILCDCIYELVEDNHFTKGNVRMKLNLPYMPYARQDRIFEKGNPKALENFLWTLSDIGGFDEIECCDIHNWKAIENFNEKLSEPLPIKNISQLECFKKSLSFDTKKDWDMVLSVDKGSRDKASTIANYLNIPVYNCEKERDISTGRIVKSILPEVDFSGKKVLIPDDISDGSGSFVGLASQLKEVGVERVDLYVTHAIFAKDLDVCKESIDNIYCYQVVGNYINKEDIMKFNLREEK